MKHSTHHKVSAALAAAAAATETILSPYPQSLYHSLHPQPPLQLSLVLLNLHIVYVSHHVLECFE
jgi:hypothetical protein